MGGSKRYEEQVEHFKEGKTSHRKSDSLSVYADKDRPKEIYSYNTAIAFQDKDGKVYLNKGKYSQTTSVQQNVIRRKLNPEELTTEEFEKKRKELYN